MSDESIQAAITLLTNTRTTDPLDTLEEAARSLVSYLSTTASSPAVAVVPKVAVALLQLSTTAPSLWELGVEAVVGHVSTSAALPWTARCLVAKKLPSVLDGQNAWPDANVVKLRTTAVVNGLVAHVEALRNDSSAAPQPQEIRIVADALAAVLHKNAFAVAAVASRIAATSSSLRDLLPLLIAQRPPASFCSAVENALCSSTSTSPQRNVEEDLKLLPAAYEGKGSAALRTLVTTVANDGITIIVTPPEGANDDDGAALTAYGLRVQSLLKDGEANPTAFRLALSSVDVLTPLLRTWSHLVQRGLGAASSPPQQLSLLRSLTTLIVVSGVTQSDAATLVEDPTIIERLASPATPAFSDESTDVSVVECYLIVAKKLLITADPSSSTTTGKGRRTAAPTSGAKEAATPVPLDADAAQGDEDPPSAIARVRAALKVYCGAALSPLEDVIKGIQVAEGILQAASRQGTKSAQQAKAGGKRPREEVVPTTLSNTTVVDQAALNADGSATPSAAAVIAINTVHELKQYHNAVAAVKDLAKYHALGVDHKVRPSWVA